jgi:hypothetical protein
MEMQDLILLVASTLFGAGGAWGTMQSKIKQNAKDIADAKTDFRASMESLDEKIDRLDSKVERVVSMLLEDRRGHHR